MINILCVNSDSSLLNKMGSVVGELIPSATVFKEKSITIKDVKKIKSQIVIMKTSIENYDVSKQIYNEDLNVIVIFVGESKDEAYDVLKAHGKGFIIGELTKDNLKEELTSLRLFDRKKRVEIKTFGNFDILLDGKSLKFSRSKSKELIAYLIDKKGTSVSSSELIVNLWEEHDVDRTTRSMLHNLITDIRQVLTKYDILDIIEIDRNAYRIVEERISCDYYDLLKGRKSAINKFTGEYMASYEWAVFTSSNLSEMMEKY